MIREQFLEDITKNNLFSLKILRDTLSVVETAVFYDRVMLVKTDRILRDCRVLLVNNIRLSNGFVFLEEDNIFDTVYTLKADKLSAEFTGLGLDEILYNSLYTLKSKTKTEVGIRGSLCELQLKLCREIISLYKRAANFFDILKTNKSTLYRLPEYVLVAFEKICESFIKSLNSCADENYVSPMFDEDIFARIKEYLSSSLNTYNAGEIIENLKSCTDFSSFAVKFLSFATEMPQCDPIVALCGDIFYRLSIA